MKRLFGSWMIWMILGVMFAAYPICTAGFSFISAPAGSGDDISALYSQDGDYRPFREFRFETVIFSGLYLSSGDGGEPTDWVMCGFIDGRFLPFYMRAASDEHPDDMTNVSFILRRPSSVNSAHDEWVVASLIDDIVSQTDYSLDEATGFFTSEVLEADRNGAAALSGTFFFGCALVLFGCVLLAFRLHRRGGAGDADRPVASGSPVSEEDFGFEQL